MQGHDEVRRGGILDVAAGGILTLAAILITLILPLMTCSRKFKIKLIICFTMDAYIET